MSVTQSDNTVAAEFAAKVAACAMDTKSPAQSPTPDSMTLDSVSDSDILHKQPPVVPISERVSSTLNSASEEFVPRSIALQILPPSEAPVELPPQPPVVVPTVSAETDSPPVEIQRPLLVIKNATLPSAPLTQSPLKTTTKKQKSSENERQQSAVIPLPSQSQAEVRENKKGPKNVQREESTPLPKERREKPRSELSSVPSTITSPEQVPNPPEAAVVTTLPPATKENIVQEVEDLYDNKTQHQNGETPEHVVPQAPIPAHASVPAPVESKFEFHLILHDTLNAFTLRFFYFIKIDYFLTLIFSYFYLHFEALFVVYFIKKNRGATARISFTYTIYMR